jgi:hypothetical protein
MKFPRAAVSINLDSGFSRDKILEHSVQLAPRKSQDFAEPSYNYSRPRGVGTRTGCLRLRIELEFQIVCIRYGLIEFDNPSFETEASEDESACFGSSVKSV